MTKALAGFAWVAVVVFGLLSIYSLFVGLTFGFSLFNLDNLKLTWLWLGVVAAPLPIAFALRWRRNSQLLLLVSIIAACVLFAPYLLEVHSR